MNMMSTIAAAPRPADTSKLDRMELRQQIAAFEDTRAAIVAEIAAAEAPFLERITAIQQEMLAATQALTERLAAHDASGDDIDRDEVFETDDDGIPKRCCVSGLVLLERDRLVEDPHGNFALADAIAGWPAEPQDLPDDDADDEEE